MNLDMPIAVKGPAVLTATRFYNETLHRVNGWRHRNAARGGFIRASFGIPGDTLYLTDWFEHGLGRQITRYDHQGGVMWEGYVHSLTLNLPSIQYTLSLENLANRVLAVYSPTDFSGPIPISGEPTVTATVNETPSQDLYGICEYVENAGNVWLATANAARDLHFAKYKYPTRSPRAVFGGEVSLAVECRGYSDWYRRRYYTATTTGTANASTVVAAVNTSVGQFIARTEIDTNTLSTPQYYDSIHRELAYDILNRIADAGDGTNRWNWGVYEGRVLHFKRAASTVDYLMYMGDPAQKVYTTTGLTLEPWQLRPDRFVRIPDSAILQVNRESDFTRDLQVQYIQAVDWSEEDPFTWSIEYLEGDELASLVAGLAASGVRM